MALPEFPDTTTKAFGVLAFDYGTQWIGLAHGQSVTGTAQALSAIKARDGVPDWEQLEKIIRQWQPAMFVVGVPYHLDGSRTPLCDRVEKFARRLNGRFNLPCYGIDEKLSSVAAEELQKDDRKASLDSLAAKIILENWFASLKSRG